MITIQGNKFVFNGVRKDVVVGRTSFKLANMVGYHYSGRGGTAPGHYSLGVCREWIEHNQSIFGKDVILRVLLETAGWDPNTPGMFGSAPQDQGFWNVNLLRDGARETSMHPLGNKVLEWFYKTSEEMGCAFELVIVATLKHDDVSTGEIDHVIRQVGVRMGELEVQYPKALCLPSVCNEWNAHSSFTIQDVDMWAVRWFRDNYGPKLVIVDGGGGDKFEFAVGPGAYSAGMIHPLRTDRDWELMPDLGWLYRKTGGRPVGFTESMYWVEPKDTQRATEWYRNRNGWTNDFAKYKRFATRALESIDYFIFHDEKGSQCNKNWPIPETMLEAWCRKRFGVVAPPPEPPPEPPTEPPTRSIFYRIIQVLLELLKRYRNG